MSNSLTESTKPEVRTSPSVRQTVSAYIQLTKPRIMVMLVFTAYCAMVVALGRVPNVWVTIWTMVGLGLSAGGGAAINMWYDRDIDVIMRRTSGRPIPMGLVKPTNALIYGITLMVLSFVELMTLVNWLAAVLTLAGGLYYAVIYTMWLKRTTPQNIVVGGGAGAFPPLVGWAAVTGHLSWAAFAMFGIILLWTPAHFWALALYKNDDYTRANVPMMPVVRGPKATKRQMIAYTICLVLLSLSMYFTGHVSVIYMYVALFLGFIFLAFNIRLKFEADTRYVWAKRTFFWSLLYLPLLFVSMIHI